MLLGPIFSVELVTGARRPRYYVLRVVYAGALLAALSIACLVGPLSDSGAVANATAGFFMAFGDGSAKLISYAIDPITAKLAWDTFVPPGHFGSTGAHVLCLGAGGSGAGARCSPPARSC